MGVDEGAEYTFFQWVRVVRLGPGPDPRSSKTFGDSLPTSAEAGAAAPWDLAGKWLAGEQRRAVQRFARLCSYFLRSLLFIFSKKSENIRTKN